MKVVVLAGGVGAARFLEGLVQVIPQQDISVIVNTGDDETFFGLHVSPDIDTIIYTLSGNNNEAQGWGLKEETFAVAEQLKKLGNDTWFTLGDKDLATHIHRSALLKGGKTLSEITKELTEKFGLDLDLLPMTDDTVRTEIKTHEGTLSFQEYFVKRRHQDKVLGIEFKNVTDAKPAPGVLRAIDQSDVIIFAPSNPFVSVGSILAVPGIKSALQNAKAKKAGISPIVGGKAIKGPADTMLKDLGMEPSANGVAKYYNDLLDIFIIDEADQEQKEEIEKTGLKVVVMNTIMKDKLSKKILAQKVLENIYETNSPHSG